MSNLSNNMRPGVYSAYQVTSHHAAPRSRRFAAVVAAAPGQANVPVACATWQAAQEAFPGDAGAMMRGALRILFDRGVSRVYGIPVADEDYGPALDAAASLEEVGALVCDCATAPHRAKVKAAAEAASAAKREQMAYLGVDDVQEALTAAAALDSARVVLACPAALPTGLAAEPSAFYTAAALAGAVLGADDAIHNFGGEALSCLNDPRRLAEEDIQALLAAGVTVVEPVGESVEIIRALTTKSGSQRALGGLNTTLIIDDVLRGVRASLEGLLKGGRISATSRDSIAAQVVVELAAKQRDGLIESFESPVVSAHPEDPSICVVALSFQVAHVLSQIHL